MAAAPDTATGPSLSKYNRQLYLLSAIETTLTQTQAEYMVSYFDNKKYSYQQNRKRRHRSTRKALFLPRQHLMGFIGFAMQKSRIHTALTKHSTDKVTAN